MSGDRVVSNEIMNTGDIAESEMPNGEEPGDVQTDAVATHEPEGIGIEFHVSMRDYTMRDMEQLIVEAAAMQIIGKFGSARVAKAIEDRCAELLHAKATKALERVTTEIIDQPLTPSFGDKKPVTMREMIGLTAREYMAQGVDTEGKPHKADGWNGGRVMSRIEYLIWRGMSNQFKSELEKATTVAIVQMQREIKAAHEKLLAEQLTRFRDALAKAAPPLLIHS